MNEHRANLRTQVEVPVSFTSGDEKGFGTILNVSRSAALLANNSIQPEIVAPVAISLGRGDGDPPDPLVGTVVRHSASGFAVRFAKADQALRDLVADRDR